MKSFRRLGSLVLNSHSKAKDKPMPAGPELTQDADLIAQGMQELREMTARYEGLVAISSQVAACAYDFSGAVQDMGSYCMKNFGSMEQEDIGKIFETVGKVQFEISKFLDLYGSHVSKTIVVPTEFLLTELRHLEDTKRQYDAKRRAYDSLRSKGKTRNANVKGDAYMEKQIKRSKTECEDLTVFISCRLLSLQAGRPRNLITQAARHYTAQVQLFSGALEVLRGIEQYMNSIMQERNIDGILSSAAPSQQASNSFDDPPQLSHAHAHAAVVHEVSVDEDSRSGSVSGSPADLKQQQVMLDGKEEGEVSSWQCEQGHADASAAMSPVVPLASTRGTPSRRPPTLPMDDQDIFVSLLNSSTSEGSKVEEDRSSGSGVLGETNTQVEVPVQQARIQPPVVRLGVPVLSDARSSRRYSQSGPLTSAGTPWTTTNKSSPSVVLGTSPSRLPRAPKLQINELHKLPAPPRPGSTTPPTPTASRPFNRSGPLMKSQDDGLPPKSRSAAQRGSGVAGGQTVSMSFSLPLKKVVKSGNGSTASHQT